MRHPGWVLRASQCPSVLSGHPSHSPPGNGQQSPGLMTDIGKKILSFNRDGKVSASGIDVPKLSHFSVWKQAGKAGLNSAWSKAGLQQDSGACWYLPGCDGWGWRESCRRKLCILHGAHRLPKSNKKRQRAEVTRARGGRKDVVVAQPSGAAAVLCPLLGTPQPGWLQCLPETPAPPPSTRTGSSPCWLAQRPARASPNHATLGTAALNVRLWMSEGCKTAKHLRGPLSSPGLAHQWWTNIAIPHCSQNVCFQGVRRREPSS